MKIKAGLFILYLLFCCILASILLEIFVRMRASKLYGFNKGSITETYKIDDETGLRILEPNLEIKGQRVHIRINALGFRGEAFDTPKSDSTIRIAALGASTTYCAEVSNNDSTWLEVLRTKLAREFSQNRFEVVNGGVPGYGIASSLKNLRYRILKLKPDIVILYHATNDISYQSRRAAARYNIIEEQRTHYTSSFASFLSKHSQAFDLIYKNLVIYLRQNNREYTSRLSEFPKSYSEPFLAYMDSIRRECERIDAPLVIFTFSTRFRRGQPLKQQLKNMNTALYYMPWMAPNTLFEAFEIFNREMFQFALRYDNVYADTLHNSIPGDGEHFVDSVHFTDTGCRLMAERVFGALVRERLIEQVFDKRS